MSVPLPLKQVLSALASSFHSVDVRCAVKKYSPGWLSLLTSIRISARPPEEVQTRYQELESGGQRREAEPFRVLWEARPFNQIENILGEMASAKLSVEGETVRFHEQVRLEELHGQFERLPNLVIPWIGESWPATHYPFGNRSLQFSDTEIVGGVRRRGWRSGEAMTAHFLDLDPQRIYSTFAAVFFHIEMPAKIEVQALANQMPELLVRAERSLEHFTLYFHSDQQKGKPSIIALENRSSDGIWTLYRGELPKSDLTPDDAIFCTLTHPEVPVLDEVNGILRNFMPIAHLNPLLACLRKFWDMKEFSGRLEQPYDKPSTKKGYNPQHMFQESVATLLTLAGFQTIDLGKEEFIRGAASKVERATLDILAYHAMSKTLILGACTIAPPGPKDIQGVVETAAILRAELPRDAQVQLVPMIFSVQEQEHPNHGEVRIFNSRKIKKLRRLIESGQEDQFIRSFEWPSYDVLEEP